jgi:hypothetical protein
MPIILMMIPISVTTVMIMPSQVEAHRIVMPPGMDIDGMKAIYSNGPILKQESHQSSGVAPWDGI